MSRAIIFHRFHVAMLRFRATVHRYSNNFGDYNDRGNCVAHNGSHFDKIKATGWILYRARFPRLLDDLTGELPYEDLSLAPFRCNIELASEISCSQTRNVPFESLLVRSLPNEKLLQQGIVMIKISSQNSFPLFTE